VRGVTPYSDPDANSLGGERDAAAMIQNAENPGAIVNTLGTEANVEATKKLGKADIKELGRVTETVEAAATPEEREALGFRDWPASGEQVYRVGYQTDSGGIRSVDVTAATGDEAALKAQAEARRLQGHQHRPGATAAQDARREGC
jgi:hypothetical protein